MKFTYFWLFSALLCASYTVKSLNNNLKFHYKPVGPRTSCPLVRGHMKRMFILNSFEKCTQNPRAANIQTGVVISKWRCFIGIDYNTTGEYICYGKAIEDLQELLPYDTDYKTEATIFCDLLLPRKAPLYLAHIAAKKHPRIIEYLVASSTSPLLQALKLNQFEQACRTNNDQALTECFTTHVTRVIDDDCKMHVVDVLQLLSNIKKACKRQDPCK